MAGLKVYNAHTLTKKVLEEPGMGKRKLKKSAKRSKLDMFLKRKRTHSLFLGMFIPALTADRPMFLFNQAIVFGPMSLYATPEY